MSVHVILSILLAGPVSSSSASKEYLRHGPLLSGAIIKYCEKNEPKNCQAIDRSKEPLKVTGKTTPDVGIKIAELLPDFGSLSVQFPKSPDLPEGFEMSVYAK